MGARFGVVDHLVLACPDLDEGTRHVEHLLDVEVTPGGQHLGLGTRNALVGLGPGTYLEIIGPDGDQPDPPEPRWFRIDELTAPRLVTWAARATELMRLTSVASAAGVELGSVGWGGRKRPDGSELSWEVTDPRADRDGGVIPFFIDWGDTRHPSVDLTGGCSLAGLTLRHPEAALVAARLRAIGLRMPVEENVEPAVLARIETRAGVIDLG